MSKINKKINPYHIVSRKLSLSSKGMGKFHSRQNAK